MAKEAIIVSACLLGIRSRYNGEEAVSEEVSLLSRKYELIPVCPELLGGLSVPRPPAEILGGRVIDKEGADVTANFILGAEKTAEIAERHGCSQAVLKARSPSCGAGVIYDGTFSGKRISGNGITADRLFSLGINIVSEDNLNALR